MPFRRKTFSPLEIQAPDIRAYRQGNVGLDYVTTLDSGVPGPHVMINAVTHGNELCGVHALLWLFARDPAPARGKLTLSFANWRAYQSFDPSEPYASRFVDEDFNRVWDEDTLKGARKSKEISRAQELQPLVSQVDFLLDLHSMHQESPALMLCGMQEKALALAQRVGVPTYLVRDRGHDAGRRMRDFGEFDDPASPKTALLVECGQHWQAESVEMGIQTAWRFLLALNIMPPTFFTGLPCSDSLPEQRVVTVSGPVTIQSHDFEFLREYQSMEVIPEAGTLIARDGSQEIRTPYDACVLVMPGRHLQPGASAVRFGRMTDC